MGLKPRYVRVMWIERWGSEFQLSDRQKAEFDRRIRSEFPALLEVEARFVRQAIDSARHLAEFAPRAIELERESQSRPLLSNPLDERPKRASAPPRAPRKPPRREGKKVGKRRRGPRVWGRVPPTARATPLMAQFRVPPAAGAHSRECSECGAKVALADQGHHDCR